MQTYDGNRTGDTLNRTADSFLDISKQGGATEKKLLEDPVEKGAWYVRVQEEEEEREGERVTLRQTLPDPLPKKT